MAVHQPESSDNGGSRPVPDPTLLTTQQLIREIAALKQYLETYITSARDVIDTRLGGMDKAIELLQRTTDKMPEFVRDQVGQLRDLHNEVFHSVEASFDERDKRVAQAFASIDTQFAERDKRTEQLSLADKTAIAAALQAQKEAAGATTEATGAAQTKMEANFTKLIEQGQTLVQSVSRNLEDKINDLKSRLDRGEGKTSVSDPAVADAVRVMSNALAKMQETANNATGHSKGISDSWGALVGLAGIIVAGIAVIAFVMHVPH
jgi:septation ring formation regulator EzrA